MFPTTLGVSSVGEGRLLQDSRRRGVDIAVLKAAWYYLDKELYNVFMRPFLGLLGGRHHHHHKWILDPKSAEAI